MAVPVIPWYAVPRFAIVNNEDVTLPTIVNNEDVALPTLTLPTLTLPALYAPLDLLPGRLSCYW